MGKNTQDNELTQDEMIAATPAVAAEEPSAELSELEQALAKVEEFKDALQRERADFQNFRKRIEREKEEMRAQISGNIIGRYLPIADDFERALAAVPDAEMQKDWMKGISLIHRKFQNVLDAEGIQTIDPLGEEFDPNYHEAIGTDEPSADYASGQVTAVLQKGYMKGDKVLRPAIVRVAS